MASTKVPAVETLNSTEEPPSVPFRIETLCQRSDFLRAARARHKRLPGMMVQARPRKDAISAVRVGFTCSKKVGNAVARNRAKRRLREVARLLLPKIAHPGWDYVLIGRAGATETRPFDLLQQDLTQALAALHPDPK